MPYVYAGENIVIVVHMHRVGVLVHYESIKSTCKEQALLLAALPVLPCTQSFDWIPPHIRYVLPRRIYISRCSGRVVLGVNNHIKVFELHPLQDQKELLTLVLKFIRLWYPGENPMPLRSFYMCSFIDAREI